MLVHVEPGARERMLQTDSQGTEVRRIARAGSLELAVVGNGPGGLGAILDGPEAAGRIAGVQLAPLVIRPDDRGYFEELFRPCLIVGKCDIR